MSWLGLGAVFSTVVGFGIWSHLMKIYPASTVAPFSLLVPVSGTLFAALLLGERFGAWRLSGWD